MKKQKLLATRNFFAVLAVALLVIPSVARAQAKATVVEEIIARVNNDIITMSDYQRADQQLREEVAHDCTGCPADKVQT
ncbi:MAG: hypothetical protein WA867_07960, partial [Candidatus Acidiferrales bacterium]